MSVIAAMTSGDGPRAQAGPRGRRAGADVGRAGDARSGGPMGADRG